MPLKGATKDVASRVLTYLSDSKPGTVINRSELCMELGLKESQVVSVMHRILRDERFPLEVIARGHTWRVLAPASEPEAEADDGMVHLIVDEWLTEDHALVRDGDGVTFLLKRIGPRS